MNSRGLFKDQIHADANSSFLCLVIFAYKVHALNKTRHLKNRIFSFADHCTTNGSDFRRGLILSRYWQIYI